jgi:hypothetical protein
MPPPSAAKKSELVLAARKEGGGSLLATAIAAFQGYKAYEDYRRQVKTNPAFFLWKLKH